MQGPSEPREDDPQGPMAPEKAPPSSQRPRAYRLTALRPSSLPPPADESLLRALADVLLAAAHVDGTMCERERRTLTRLLVEIAGVEALPQWLDEHIRAFDARRFDLATAAGRLREIPLFQRRHIVELVRAVCDANNAYDLEEERFLIQLALALSLAQEDAADLVVHAAPGIDGPAKRLFDILFASAAIATGWPLALGIALGVRLSTPGPVLFKQRRYGRGGKEIVVWKFRTMRVAEDGSTVHQARRTDPRITRFGAFLRRTSLDELPQFVNVLLGEMSVVGPRPHAVAHNQQYRTQILEYMLRHKVKPGITGWAQVNGWRGETDTLEKMIQRVAHDLEYIRRYSLLLDLKIIVSTAFGTAARNSAY
jgi:lipopolysaccharide/colanic/teichoic acid biosynthesis glycosyltransferase